MIHKTVLTFGHVLNSSSKIVCDVLKNENEPVGLADLEVDPEHGCREKPQSALLHPVWGRCCRKGYEDGDMVMKH